VTDVGRPVLYGASYSVYTRIARLAFEEKGAPYRSIETDVFDPGGPPADCFRRQPFGRIPALDHEGSLYETVAIAQYADEAFPGPRLQPPSAADRARMAQIVSVLDSYGYRPMVRDVYVERCRRRRRGVGRTKGASPPGPRDPRSRLASSRP
jgi:glutathione S-transferase